MPDDNLPAPDVSALFGDICKLIEDARERANQALDVELAFARLVGEMPNLKRSELLPNDPDLRDFLGVNDGGTSEAITKLVPHLLEEFLLGLQDGFAIASYQKSVLTEDGIFSHDLLCYHIDLRRLIVIELKLEEVTFDDKEQMKNYLRWLDRCQRHSHEEAPIGLLLHCERAPQRIELIQLDEGDARVGEYFTKNLPLPKLEKELRKAVSRARELAVLRRVLQENQ